MILFLSQRPLCLCGEIPISRLSGRRRGRQGRGSEVLSFRICSCSCGSFSFAAATIAVEPSSPACFAPHLWKPAQVTAVHVF